MEIRHRDNQEYGEKVSHAAIDLFSTHSAILFNLKKTPPYPIKRGGKEKARERSDDVSIISWVCIHELSSIC